MTKNLLGIACVSTALITACSPALGDSAADKILSDIENVCLTAPTPQEASTYITAKGGKSNGKDTWWYRHLNDPNLRSHQIKLTDKGCKIDAEGWANEAKKPSNVVPLNYDSFKKKFASYFKAEYLKDKSGPNSGDAYFVKTNGKTYGVRLEHYPDYEILNILVADVTASLKK